MGLAYRLLGLLGVVYAAHRETPRNLPQPFRQYPGDEYHEGPNSSAAEFAEKTEWVFARLMYPSIDDAHFRHAGWDWRRRAFELD